MAGSTISGNAGVQANNFLVFAVPVDVRGAITGQPIPAVVSATGAYSLSGLPAGTYKLVIDPYPDNPPAASAPQLQAPVLNQPLITVDGSSTYNV